jgi:hypothetical protein
MTRRTGVILSAEIDNEKLPRLRVKLDAQSFPYVIVGYQRVTIASTEFPRQFSMNYGLSEGTLHLVEGAEELARILSNPELTVDKLSLKQLARVG